MYKLQGFIKWHNYDLEFRDKLLPLVPLAILYSNNSHPDAGYERAKKFIEEFNNEFGLDLKTDEINEIMYRDYNIDKHPIAKMFVKKLKKK